jgi:glycosyltransferase involved in cell wall biosynthesis
MLRDAVASVLAQSWRPIEIIIVNDGSTDDTAELANALAAMHPEVTALHQLNAGPGAAWEAGRQRARGSYVQYLDSDDLLEPRKFELQVEGLARRPECGASYGWTRIRRPDGTAETKPFKRTGERIETMFPALLESRWWDTSTPLFRRSVTDRTGAWLDLRVEEDWEYDARTASFGTKLHYCEAWVSETRQLDPARISLRRGRAVTADRARAHAMIYEHARRAGIGVEAPEMRRFARELFLLARQCGAAGMPQQSEMLFKLSREASGAGADRLQFRAYSALARVLGWSVVGRLACWSDRLRW